jgi:hypothetical protein
MIGRFLYQFIDQQQFWTFDYQPVKIPPTMLKRPESKNGMENIAFNMVFWGGRLNRMAHRVPVKRGPKFSERGPKLF